MTTKPGGTPYADGISTAASQPARSHQELDDIGHGLLKYVVRLIVSLVICNERVKHAIFGAVISNPRLAGIIVEQARAGLADELRVRNTVVHEVDLKNIRFETTHDIRRETAGASWIAIIIGATVGLLAGIWAMNVLDASPVDVSIASQTTSVGIAQAVDKPWFITIALILTTLLGAAFGGLKKRYKDVAYPTGIRPIYNVDDEECREIKEH